MDQKIKNMINEADMVLIGIGEEFEGIKYFKNMPEYQKLQTQAEETGKDWMIPALNRYFGENAIVQEQNEGVSEETFYAYAKRGLKNLAELLQGKNYFVITTTTNDLVWEIGFKEGRVVAPCGGSLRKQCMTGKECTVEPVMLTEEETKQLEMAIHSADLENVRLEKCECGSEMLLNNIYSENYDERGYLPDWQIYTKWLQGTLNRKLCILELGVGMKCPSVIRFPFEKIGYFYQKADFIRVNQNLYHLTEELKEKGISISENAVDWLTSMC